MTHRECDDHWRDNHGPLALQMHLAMCDYSQLAVVDTIHGQELDGIAMCAFSNRDDLSTKFFNDDDAKKAIIKDVSIFQRCRSVSTKSRAATGDLNGAAMWELGRCAK